MKTEISKNTSVSKITKGNKKARIKELYEVLYSKPQSRRMAITEIGYPDQTYLVTQPIFDLIRLGLAQVIGKRKCTRSTRLVQFVTTNPDLFINPFANQLNMFENEQ